MNGKRSGSVELERRDVTSIADQDGIRLDQWLSKRFTYRSRNQWQRLIKDGNITVNGRVCRGSKELRHGDKVAFAPESDEPDVDSSYHILYETEGYIAVNKSGDLPCHPAGPYFHNTLWFLLSQSTGAKLACVNRLDRETSGVTLFAKDSETAAKLASLFATKAIRKEYVAIVHGQFPESLEARGALIDDANSPIRKKRAFTRAPDAPEGAETCDTRFELIRAVNDLSVTRAIPGTGRLHQIRATLCSLGFPLVGDKIYGVDDTLFERFITDKLTSADRARLIIGRQALHAESLTFPDPLTGERVTISAPIPDDMRQVIDRAGAIAD